MRRREFISLLGGSAAAWPLAARAQEKTDDLPRIGILHSSPNENFEATTEGLREARYIDGQNVLLEKRFYGTGTDRIEAFAKELVALKCKVIFASAPYAIQAALKMTNRIPIVGVDLESDLFLTAELKPSLVPAVISPACSLIFPNLAENRSNYSGRLRRGFRIWQFSGTRRSEWFNSAPRSWLRAQQSLPCNRCPCGAWKTLKVALRKPPASKVTGSSCFLHL